MKKSVRKYINTARKKRVTRQEGKRLKKDILTILDAYFNSLVAEQTDLLPPRHTAQGKTLRLRLGGVWTIEKIREGQYLIDKRTDRVYWSLCEIDSLSTPDLKHMFGQLKNMINQ